MVTFIVNSPYKLWMSSYMKTNVEVEYTNSCRIIFQLLLNGMYAPYNIPNP